MQRINYLATAALFAIGLNCSHANSQENGVQHVGKDRIEVRIAGPFQNAQHDMRLQKFLREPYAFEWDFQTTASQIAKDLSSCVPFFVDHHSLEEIGLSADTVVHSAFQGQTTKKQKAPSKPSKSNFDPFAPKKPDRNTNPTTKKKATATASSEGQTVRWWDKVGGPSSPAKRGPNRDTTNAAMLFHFLDSADLTIQSRAGQWLITTEEGAEQTQAARLYDVTRIASVRDVRPASEPSAATFGFCGSVSPRRLDQDSLTQSIQTSIVPEVWECLGGPSTLNYLVVDGRLWLVVNTSVTVHWQVEAFLNQLVR